MRTDDLLEPAWKALHSVDGWEMLGIIRQHNVIVMTIGGEHFYFYLRRYNPLLKPPLIEPKDMHCS